MNKDTYGVLSKEYLQALINITSSIQKPQVNATQFANMNFTDDELKNIALSFYGNLDQELSQTVNNLSLDFL